MKTLKLTLKKKWFDMILSGEKTEEYREMKPYWLRLANATLKYDKIKFTNGYGNERPNFTIELKDVEFGGKKFSRKGKEKWGADNSTNFYILKLGRILYKSNCG